MTHPVPADKDPVPFFDQDLNALGCNPTVRGIFDRSWADGAAAVWTDFQKAYDGGAYPFLRCAFDRDDLDDARDRVIGHPILSSVRRVLVLGTGGSSLGGQSLMALHQHRFWGNDGGGGRHPEMIFLDNVDPHTFQALIADLDPHETGVLAISKSGETAETLCQLLTLMPVYQNAHGDGWAGFFVALTEDKPSTLKQLADGHQMTFIPHPKDIGGRFSILSVVGLLPLLWAGYDGMAVRSGAADYLNDLIKRGVDGSNAPLAAAFWAGALRHGAAVTQSVMMPYVDRLIPFSGWYCQLWAESLGKKGQGITPLRALGTVDQHSQLQLYLDGPKDKVLTLIGVETQATGTPIHVANNDPWAYFQGKTMGDLMAAEWAATCQTLKNNGCPVRVMGIPVLDDRTMGALAASMMVELVLTAAVLGIDRIFDQDAVEESKRLTRHYLTHGMGEGGR